MKCRIEVQRLQYAMFEIDVPDEATGDEIEQKALECVTEWKTIGNPYIEWFDDITPYQEELEHLPS